MSKRKLNIEELIGKKFGMLTLIKPDKTEKGRIFGLFKCDCGNDKIARIHDVLRGSPKSCGCSYSPDLTGMKIDKLLVIKHSHSKEGYLKIWLCKCDCGNECYRSSLDLRVKRKKVKSCGCVEETALIGQTFRELTVMELSHISENQRYWKCKCGCGKTVILPTVKIKNGKYKKCICTLNLDLSEFEDIKGYEGLYLINKDGVVVSTGERHKNPQIMVPHEDRYGYIYLCLTDDKSISKKYKLHRLVAQQYIPNPNNLPIVNHKDGDKKNNSISNLEWCTVKENVRHAFDTGLAKAPGRKFTFEGAESIRQEYKNGGITQRELAEKYGVYISTIEKMMSYETYKN